MTISGVSGIVASVRPPDVVHACLRALHAALDVLPGPAELLLVRDGAYHPRDDVLTRGSARHRTRVIWTGRRRGSAYARCAGVDAAAYDTLLFTDDDTIVPANWACTMSEAAARHGVATGSIRSRSTTGFWQHCDEAIDGYRTAARTADGTLKFLSFPNLAISRDLFTAAGLDVSAGNRVDDIELACRLRLAGIRPHLADTAVAALYPASYRQFIRRKIRHGIGMGRLRAQLGADAWQQLELGRSSELLQRWIALSRHISAGAPPVRRAQLTVANLAYCAAFLTTAAVHAAAPHLAAVSPTGGSR